MDPNALEQEIDQAAQAIHSSVNSMLHSMQSSVFGGLEVLSREMSALEKNSKEYLEPTWQSYHQHLQQWPMMWTKFGMDGPKKRYRITIEELPPLEKDDQGKKVFSTGKGHDNSGALEGTVKGKGEEGEFTIRQGQPGTPDEGKTVITTSVAPGLLDWLLFTTHEDSFFRRLGQQSQQQQQQEEQRQLEDATQGQRVRELHEGESENEAPKKKVVPALVEKVKQVGTSWEKDTRHWWQQRKRDDDQPEEYQQGLNDQHHVFSGTGQSELDQDEERHSRRWPRGRSWGCTESYNQSTVTRPDGTVEHRIVNTVNGETETVIKIEHPDGTTEQTITRSSDHDDDHHRAGGGFRDRWLSRRRQARQNESDEDRERDSVASVVAEAYATERDQQGHDEEATKSRTWPPKAWTRRQERERNE
ncbi:hypothetical protein EDD11_008233 [Mortierella claussenii]|nr:hypothetical protein EDD11_008233 [Mortierella claussenii]